MNVTERHTISYRYLDVELSDGLVSLLRKDVLRLLLFREQNCGNVAQVASF